MPKLRMLALGALLFTSAACDSIMEQFATAPPGLPEGVDDMVKKQDYVAAEPLLRGAVKENPKNVEAATYYAFILLEQGKYDEADKVLAAAEEGATEEQLGGLKLRRAVIGGRKGDLDAIRNNAKASGLAEGKLMAAEVHIVDLEADAAVELLKGLEGNPGIVGTTAKQYLSLLEGGAAQQALAEVTALWALGDRKTACEHAAEVIPALPDEVNGMNKVELQILWAGRAVTSDQVGVATTLISELPPLPSTVEDLAWRVQATRAMIAIAEGEYEKGIQMFDQLEEGAPPDGLADARATAACISGNVEVAQQLAKNVESSSVAWGLYCAGATGAAKKAAPDGVLKQFLEQSP